MKKNFLSTQNKEKCLKWARAHQSTLDCRSLMDRLIKVQDFGSRRGVFVDNL